jgi:hypothetical protein
MSPSISELTRISPVQAPQISTPLDAKLEFDGFKPATIPELPAQLAQPPSRYYAARLATIPSLCH